MFDSANVPTVRTLCIRGTTDSQLTSYVAADARTQELSLPLALLFRRHRQYPEPPLGLCSVSARENRRNRAVPANDCQEPGPPRAAYYRSLCARVNRPLQAQPLGK